MGHAVAQAVSRRLPTVITRVRARVRSCGVCGRQSGIRTGFLLVLLFPLPSIPPTAPHSSIIIRGWCSRPNGGRRTKWGQSHPTPRKLKIFLQKATSPIPTAVLWFWEILAYYLIAETMCGRSRVRDPMR
jgi:hypothetical protein